jgi:toxin ParE1/3/4
VKRVRVSGPARRDIAHILRTSETEFGAAARTRYRRLIDKALNDLAQDPSRLGVRAIDDVRAGYFIYHLRFSKYSGEKAAIRRPRHLIAFSVDGVGDVIIARLFHERQWLIRHLDFDTGG